MKICGIDPGAKGAIVMLDSVEKTAQYLIIPYRDDKVMDKRAVKKAFNNFADVRLIFIEKVGGRGGWASGSTFQFGSNYGQILNEISDHPYMFVSPQVWQKIAWQGEPADEPKVMSAAAFQRLNPSTRMMLKKENGVIDAFHIARYGMINQRERFTDDWNFINLAT